MLSIKDCDSFMNSLDWLKENAKDMSFNSVKDDIINSVSEKLEFIINVNSEKYRVTYKDALQFKNSENVIIVSDSEFYRIWDDIRNKCVFADSNEKNKQCVYSLLCLLNYLTSIDILDKKTNKMINGYQVNEATGRLYTLKEV